MSRYEWTNKTQKTISIGWDIPLNTFFAQIHNDAAVNDSDYCELWIGAIDSEFTELGDLLEKLPLEVRVEVNDDLQFYLLSDKFGIEDPQYVRKLPANITRRL